jgi:hypothetical protein
MLKNVHLWLASYIAQSPRRREPFAKPTHIFFCIADHFEPLWHGASREQGLERVKFWHENYPRFAKNFRDADGRPPQHTFFYPAEEYRSEFLELLAKLCAAGYGEVEIQIHHDNDTPEGLREKLETFKKQLAEHGFLARDRQNRVRFGFVHGNWALDNSRRDGRWCGVNTELRVLRDAGCYADFTLPSAPSDTQTRKINSIYYAADDERPKSHDDGIDAVVGGQPVGDLLLVQGPLALNWRNRKWGIFPRIEAGEIAAESPPSANRAQIWVNQRIGVAGKRDWVFIKLHTHGTQERNFPAILGEPARQMHGFLREKFNDGRNFVLHYVTAREVANLVRAAESGARDEPEKLRNFELSQPPIRS